MGGSILYSEAILSQLAQRNCFDPSLVRPVACSERYIGSSSACLTTTWTLARQPKATSAVSSPGGRALPSRPLASMMTVDAHTAAAASATVLTACSSVVAMQVCRELPRAASSRCKAPTAAHSKTCAGVLGTRPKRQTYRMSSPSPPASNACCNASLSRTRRADLSHRTETRLRRVCRFRTSKTEAASAAAPRMTAAAIRNCGDISLDRRRRDAR
eukprot:scaffold17376_cov118-Isochrysis_galbana.AAC.7